MADLRKNRLEEVGKVKKRVLREWEGVSERWGLRRGVDISKWDIGGSWLIVSADKFFRKIFLRERSGFFTTETFSKN